MSASRSFIAVFCLLLALVFQLATAQAANLTNTKLITRTTISCSTIMAETPVSSVANITSTTYGNKTFSLVHTSTPFVISIPRTYTRTNTQTKHTVTTTTLGFQSTSTSTRTYTKTYWSMIPGITNTTTMTASVTTTLSTVTTVLKTTSGFRNIRNTRETCRPKLPAPVLNSTLSRRDEDDDDDQPDDIPDITNSTSVVPTIGLSRLNAAAAYPSLVSCIATVVTSTGYITVLPANTTTTRIGRTPTAVVQTTTFLTSTHTKVLNNATHTRTTSSMFIFTTGVTARPSTLTSYITTTYTLSTATTTFYGACRTQRVLGPILPTSFPRAERGYTVDDIYYDPDILQLWSFYTPTNYTCCQACQDQADCAFGAWDSMSQFCYMQRRKDGLALAQNETGGVYVSANRNRTSVPFAFMAYNGPAGYLSDGGVDKD